MDTPSSTEHTSGRRLRMTTLDEQNEFVRLGRALRRAGVSDAELQRELGYEDANAFQGALQSGRVTAHLLERMRGIANARMSEERPRKNESEGRANALFEQLRDRVGAAATAPAREEPETPAAVSATRTRGPQRKRAPARGPKRQFLTTKQHERLREQVEHLWAVDKRFRNWSLLARIMGLATGQAAKRAYDVNSSMKTLQNVETFSRLHAGFGSKATTALRSGVPIRELQAHLTDGTPPAETAPEPAAPARESAVERTSALSSMPEVPPNVDFATMLELGSAIDVEVKRIFHQARFFDGVSKLSSLPSTIRWNAAQTRDRLQDALQFFGSELKQPEAPVQTREATAQPADITT